MKRLIGILAAAMLVAGVVATQLWLKLRAEHRQTAGLAARATESVAALNSPQVLDFARQMGRGTALQLYPDLAEALDLTTAEAEQILDLLGRQEGDLKALSMALAGSATMQEKQNQLLENHKAYEVQLRTALGSRYPKWQEYQVNAQARRQVNVLNQKLEAGGKPLSEAQSKALATAFASETLRWQEQVREEARQWAARNAGTSNEVPLVESLQRGAPGRQRLQQRLEDVASVHLDAAQFALYKIAQRQ